MNLNARNDVMSHFSFLLLGKGEFGQVYKGQAIGIIPDAPERNVVAVKMVKGE